MLCLDFERIWNEQLDAREGASAEIERALEAHAAACPACRLTWSRYQTLRQVLRVLDPAPAPPAGFVGRFLEAQDRERPRARPFLRLRFAVVPLAAAASLMLVAYLGWRSQAPAPVPRPVSPGPMVKSIDPQSLTDALAHAGSATWDLALETSAPAARVGREVLGSASFSKPAATLPLSVSVTPPSQVLQSVGDRVNAGVRPLSGTARHAFGFLLGPPPGDPKVASPPATGA
jgi:hypothetical protein